jgi:hypothetical protein
VYTPPTVIVPRLAFPPDTPLTLHDTASSEEFFTVAVNVSWFPSVTTPLVGKIVTLISKGGGGGSGVIVAQPTLQLVAASNVVKRMLLAKKSFVLRCGRGRMPIPLQSEGQQVFVLINPWLLLNTSGY